VSYDPLDVAICYAAQWPARTDVYQHWTSDGWRPVRSPLTPEVVIAGLTGKGPSIGGYMIAPPGVAHTLAIDFDTDDGLEQGLTLAKTMKENGFFPYVESSRRGAHLWCPINSPLPAKKIRAAARVMLAMALLPTDDPHIEIRPGSDTVEKDGLGHALRLPRMPHPKTSVRGTMFRADGSEVTGSLASWMLETDFTPVAKVMEWADKWRPPTYVTAYGHNPRAPRPDDDASASDLLMTFWSVAKAAPGRNSKCPAHGSEDRHPSLSVMKDDKRVICRVPGCILNNNDKGRGTYELRKLAPGHG